MLVYGGFPLSAKHVVEAVTRARGVAHAVARLARERGRGRLVEN